VLALLLAAVALLKAVSWLLALKSRQLSFVLAIMPDSRYPQHGPLNREPSPGTSNFGELLFHAVEWIPAPGVSLSLTKPLQW
jgi:hypothetical protein